MMTSTTRPHTHAKFGYNRFKGGVAAHARNSPLAVYFDYARLLSARLSHRNSVRLSVRPSVTQVDQSYLHPLFMPKFFKHLHYGLW